MSGFKIMPISLQSSSMQVMPSGIQDLAGRAAACLANVAQPLSGIHIGSAGKAGDVRSTITAEGPKQILHEKLYAELESKFAAATKHGRQLTFSEMISYAKSMQGGDGQLAFPRTADLQAAFSFCKGRAKAGDGQKVPMTQLESLFLGACTQLTATAYFFGRFSDMTFFPDEDNGGTKLESDW
ncbi:hypothetical protein [Janthinobacterium sp. B9-8]|uniref:hypothetical protein n=1 Tax=Janthinobacterium sp. B9-8 TaxID=1236179 RepID=UPI00061CE4AD|nr:hypothetical protein [Janthinobacterium sp. B9-8]AMC33566.1 hypothetical protein VN23_02615 [Janthinobacterium sp. B9-8]